MEDELYAKNQNYQFAKADLDVAKYNFEQAQHGHGDLESATKTLNNLVVLTGARKLKAEIIKGKVEEANKLKSCLYVTSHICCRACHRFSIVSHMLLMW